MKLPVIVLLSTLFGLPAALAVQHGLDPSSWPSETLSPSVWFGDFTSFSGLGEVAKAYWAIVTRQSPAFANSGWSFAPILVSCPLFLAIVLRFAPKLQAPKRDPAGAFGNARFATYAERALMSHGLELGIDPQSGRAVRIAVQGTLVTIAPPRTGKTSGLLIPNLSYPEPGAWAGPAVVLDSKGEVYRATRERRERLGRRVICLDPLNLVGGRDSWNPLATLRRQDILYMQKTALALLPEPTSDSETSAYFRNRAVDLIVGAIGVCLRIDRHSVAGIPRLLSDDTLFIAHLKASGGQPSARAALEIMQADPRTRDPIRSTAVQAFQWLADPRLRRLVHDSSFDLAELSSNEIDIFIAIPPEHKRVLAPLLRWFLSDLFTSIRRNRPEERVIVFIDEAAALGRFDEILTSAAELPGYGASIWSYWQDRSQLVSLYGEAGAATLINTAEVVTLSDLSAVDPAEGDRWSRALGNYTALIETFSRPTTGSGSATTSTGPQPAPLMSREDLVTMPPNELLVFPNGAARTPHPLRLRKTVAHTDPRIRPLIEAVAPVGQAR
ncbi:type IV secretory system conjugative DNA transfer family protein [Lichenibacterium dinghuense]|uniref:type IV secretory system conjugative DNA transfer family protein n=1 Tax=Lichenibacterium dinghuense TaxID=2895977 RepID=UPI001F309237|nr:type IV secretory system conjugative DNA transfer family protein [Lichenibacterium sp. 6Y81]